MRVRFRPEAAEEVREARDWYAAREDELGDQFLAAVNATVERIAGRPLAFPTVRLVPSARRAQLRRFPFALLFRTLDSDNIEVLAVAHERRRPGYWRTRLR